MSGSSDCSIGRNGLTSPPDGLIVPTAATTRSTANDAASPKASPVAIISERDDLQEADPVEVAAAQAEQRG